jgi:putative membrane protein
MLQPKGRHLPYICLVVLALSALLTWAAAQAMPGAQPGLILGNILFGLAALVHGTYLMGGKRTLAFFALTCGLAFALEMLSISTGLATPYHYTAALGPRLGGVALVVPLGWYFMLYSSHCLVNFIAEGDALSTRGGPLWILLLALLTALVMTAWDLTLDPFMVQGARAWVWDQGGPYLGIPLANYLSWVETSFILAVACRLVDRELAAQPGASPIPAMGRWWSAYPIAVYALVGLSDVAVGQPLATRVLSPFAMGIPVLAGLVRVWQPGGGDR